MRWFGGVGYDHDRGHWPDAVFSGIVHAVAELQTNTWAGQLKIEQKRKKNPILS